MEYVDTFYILKFKCVLNLWHLFRKERRKKKWNYGRRKLLFNFVFI